MHESQSTACVCFIYSLVTTGLKSKNEKRQATSIQISIASLEQRVKERREKVCASGRKQLIEEGEMKEGWDGFF